MTRCNSKKFVCRETTPRTNFLSHAHAFLINRAFASCFVFYKDAKYSVCTTETPNQVCSHSEAQSSVSDEAYANHVFILLTRKSLRRSESLFLATNSFSLDKRIKAFLLIHEMCARLAYSALVRMQKK